MAQTYNQDFNRDNGFPVTVEFEYSPGTETTYSPMYGASGGDGCEVSIVESWPNTPSFQRLCGLRNDLDWGQRPAWKRPFAWLALQFVELIVWFESRPARLSDVERERMEAWIAENHVYEYEPIEGDYF